ncbi:hypothetical protein [Nonomuraea sp. NPDC049480]|uniref:hypothetical protein n=1 Tax=Nonomuraea sp. NPDC049480 TaxID=3364353 RepID=UPI0037B00440
MEIGELLGVGRSAAVYAIDGERVLRRYRLPSMRGGRRRSWRTWESHLVRRPACSSRLGAGRPSKAVRLSAYQHP